MKKFLFIILTLFLSINIVSAKENKLVISSSDNKMYYDSKLFDSNLFMSHLDMIPGSKYNDLLVIENQTSFTFNLYLKIKKINDNELLDYMRMKLFFDDNLIYSGDVLGSNVSDQNSNFNNAFYVGKFTPGQISNLNVLTELLTEYSNTNNNDILKIDWTFYAETYDDIDKSDEIPADKENEEIIEIVPAPITGIEKNFIPIIISASGLCLLGTIIIILLIKRKKSDDNE